MMQKSVTALSSWWSALRHQHALIKELREEITHLPPLEKDPSAASNEWLANRSKIRSLLLQKDPRSFLKWDVIRATMFVVGKQPYVTTELEHLQQSSHWNDRYESAIEETSAGRPERYAHYKKSSGNLIHNAYSLCQFEEHSRSTIRDLNLVLEFGGGYGSMCRLFHNLGFAGKYIIFDFPEFSALQRYYLRSLGLQVLTVETYSQHSSGILCVSDVEHIQRAISGVTNKLFLATWSISETSQTIRSSFFDAIPDFDHYLIAYQHTFGEMNNIEYFNAFMQKHPKLTWKLWQISHLKDQFYLMG
jgi:hypothetical protein